MGSDDSGRGGRAEMAARLLWALALVVLAALMLAGRLTLSSPWLVIESRWPDIAFAFFLLGLVMGVLLRTARAWWVTLVLFLLILVFDGWALVDWGFGNAWPGVVSLLLCGPWLWLARPPLLRTTARQ